MLYLFKSNNSIACGTGSGCSTRKKARCRIGRGRSSSQWASGPPSMGVIDGTQGSGNGAAARKLLPASIVVMRGRGHILAVDR